MKILVWNHFELHYCRIKYLIQCNKIFRSPASFETNQRNSNIFFAAYKSNIASILGGATWHMTAEIVLKPSRISIWIYHCMMVWRKETRWSRYVVLALIAHPILCLFAISKNLHTCHSNFSKWLPTTYFPSYEKFWN